MASTTARTRWAMQGSWRPEAARVTSVFSRKSTVSCSLPMVGVGRTAQRNKTGMPLVRPPLMPPALFVAVTTRPSARRKGSFAALPRIFARAKPAPNSIPLIPGIANNAWERSPSTLSKNGSPSPAGNPVTAVSKMPPTLSESAFAARIASCMCSPAAASRTAKSSPERSSRSHLSSAPHPKARSVIPAISAMWVPIRMPFACSAGRRSAPAATTAAVMRPLKWPPPRVSLAPL